MRRRIMSSTILLLISAAMATVHSIPYPWQRGGDSGPTGIGPEFDDIRDSEESESESARSLGLTNILSHTDRISDGFSNGSPVKRDSDRKRKTSSFEYLDFSSGIENIRSKRSVLGEGIGQSGLRSSFGRAGPEDSFLGFLSLRGVDNVKTGRQPGAVPARPGDSGGGSQIERYDRRPRRVAPPTKSKLTQTIDPSDRFESDELRKHAIKHRAFSDFKQQVDLDSESLHRKKREQKRIIGLSEENSDDIRNIVLGFRGIGLFSGFEISCLQIGHVTVDRNTVAGSDVIDVRLSFSIDDVIHTSGLKTTPDGEQCPPLSVTSQSTHVTTEVGTTQHTTLLTTSQSTSTTGDELPATNVTSDDGKIVNGTLETVDDVTIVNDTTSETVDVVVIVNDTTSEFENKSTDASISTSQSPPTTVLTHYDVIANFSVAVETMAEKNATLIGLGIKEKTDSDEELTRTQFLVITTCSAVIGFFFIIAALLRVRNYFKRIRNHSPEPERPPDFRSCTADLRKKNWITGDPTSRRDSKGNKDKIKASVTPSASTPSSVSKPVTNGNQISGKNETESESEPLLAEEKETVVREHRVSIIAPGEEMVNQKDDPESGNDETQPLVMTAYLDDIAECSETSSSARRSISIAEEILQKHETEWRLPSSPRQITIDIHEGENEQFIVVNQIENVTPTSRSVMDDRIATRSGRKRSLQSDSGTEQVSECGITQADVLEDEMEGQPYAYSNQMEYVPGTIPPIPQKKLKYLKTNSQSKIMMRTVSEVEKEEREIDDMKRLSITNPEELLSTEYSNPAYAHSPTEIIQEMLESPVSWVNRDAVIDACMIPFEIEGESEIEKNKNSSSGSESEAVVGESPGLMTSSSSCSDSSDYLPLERLQQEAGMCYISSGWTYGSFTDGLNEINDDLFQDEILQIESEAVRIAELSEFSSLPTIPESSRENTDADDELDSKPSRKSSYNETSSLRGDADRLSLDPRRDVTLRNDVTKDFCYENEVELSEGDALSDGDDDTPVRFVDERTLLLNTLESMEATLV